MAPTLRPPARLDGVRASDYPEWLFEHSTWECRRIQSKLNECLVSEGVSREIQPSALAATAERSFPSDQATITSITRRRRLRVRQAELLPREPLPKPEPLERPAAKDGY